MYALRQAIAKAVVAYVAKYEDAASALEVRKVLVAYDRTLLVADPRRCEPKKFGGIGARSRFQKSYVSFLVLFVALLRPLRLPEFPVSPPNRPPYTRRHTLTPLTLPQLPLKGPLLFLSTLFLAYVMQ